VVIGAHSEIGANCTIDRGSWRDTSLGVYADGCGCGCGCGGGGGRERERGRGRERERFGCVCV